MIQRVQTLYIIVGTLFILAGSRFLPYAKCEISEHNLYLFSEYGGAIWLALFSLISLMSILRFNNRKQQIYYINGNLLGIITLILIIISFYFYFGPIFNDLTYNLNLTFIIDYFLGLLFFLLAKKAIRKDDELVKSINRIR